MGVFTRIACALERQVQQYDEAVARNAVTHKANLAQAKVDRASYEEFMNGTRRAMAVVVTRLERIEAIERDRDATPS